jgi:hypothetical protein
VDDCIFIILLYITFVPIKIVLHYNCQPRWHAQNSRAGFKLARLWDVCSCG